jgi:hypothetical protein
MIEEIRQIIGKLASIQIEDLLKEGRDFNFTEARPEIEALLSYASDLQVDPDLLLQIPQPRLQPLSTYLKDLDQKFEEIVSFNPAEADNPKNFVADRISNLRSIHDNLYPILGPLKAYRAQDQLKGQDFKKLQKEAEAALIQIRQASTESEKALEAARQTATQGSLRGYQKIFTDEAADNLKQAKWWGAGLILFSLGTFGVIIWLLKDMAPTLEKAQNTQVFFSAVLLKVFSVTILIYLIQLVGRNYFALMHQWSINKHRANALGVFEAMILAGTTPEIKDTILGLLAKAVFDSGDTGFISGKDMSNDGPDYIQLVRDMAKPGK